MPNTPRLPGYYKTPPQEPAPSYTPPRRAQLSRPSATTINEASPRVARLTRNEIATDKVAPIIYGEDRVAGSWLTYPIVDGGELVFAISWCDGGINGIEGVQQVYINGAAAPGGVSMTHYDGTQTTADATLQAAYSGFNDSYEGLAYTVFSVPTGTITGFPVQKQFEAVIRGRKVFDPRSLSTAYSENPGLCLLDFVEQELGIIIDLFDFMPGFEAVADRCDELVGGSETRCLIGLTIDRQSRAEDVIDLLASYAEALWEYAAIAGTRQVYVVPDAPVETPAAVLTRDDIKEGTLRITGKDAQRIPTRVTTKFRRTTGTAQQWFEDTTTRQLQGVTDGDIEAIESNVNMPGIHRSTESDRKTLVRLRRLSYPVSYAWQANDEGIKFQLGDVVQLPNLREYAGLHTQFPHYVDPGYWDEGYTVEPDEEGSEPITVQVRIMSVEIVEAGRYQITAEHYSDDIYAYDYDPGNTSAVPEHGIVLYHAGAIPAGWVRFADADGLYLVGAGGSLSHGDTGGSDVVGGSLGQTEMGGQHSGPSFVTTASGGNVAGPVTARDNSVGIQSGSEQHDHDISIPNTSVSPLAREVRWIQKTGAPGNLPVNGGVLADGNIINQAFSLVQAHIGRLAKSNAPQGNAGTGDVEATASYGTNNQDWTHQHGIAKPPQSFPGFATQQFNVLNAGPAHDHPDSSLTLTPNVQRAKLAWYAAQGATPIEPGAIIGYPDTEPLPPGWYVCDGNNGTIDLRDYFIEFSSDVEAGQKLGDNTVSITGQTGVGGEHTHKGALLEIDGIFNSRQHDTAGSGHAHSVNISAPYQPPYYAIQFIQYTGVI